MESLGQSKKMCSRQINGAGESRWQPANLGSPGKIAVKMECVYVRERATRKLRVYSTIRIYEPPCGGAM